MLLAIVAVPLAAGAQEYEGDGKVEGKIVNAEGEGLGDAVITAVFAETGTGPEAEESEGDGDFEVEDLKPGMWTLTVAAPQLGYGAEFVDVEVLEDDTPELEIVLQPMQTLLDQGSASMQAENYAEALHDYRRLFAALPDNAMLHQPIALSYKGLGWGSTSRRLNISTPCSKAGGIRPPDRSSCLRAPRPRFAFRPCRARPSWKTTHGCMPTSMRLMRRRPLSKLPQA